MWHFLKQNILLSAIIILSFLMHLDYFQKDLMGLHVWRQTYNQTTIENFYEEDMNILNPRCNERGNGDGIRRIEFPLMQWIVACSYFIFGSHILITRLVLFFIGILSIIGMYKFAFNLSKNKQLAIISAFCFSLSPMFFYYIINPMSDDLALCLGIWGLSFFYKYINQNQNNYLIYSSLLLSMSTLCKLPFVIYFALPFSYFILNWKNHPNSFKNLIIFFSTLILPILWYGWAFITWRDSAIMNGLLGSQIPLQQTVKYIQHTIFSFFIEKIIGYGSLIWFLFGVYILIKNKSNLTQNFHLLMSITFLFLLYYLYEVNAIADIHDYYLLPIYPVLFFIIGYGGMQFLNLNFKYSKELSFLFVFVIITTCYLRTYNSWDADNPGFNRDFLIYKRELQNAVPNNSLTLVGSDNTQSILFYYTHKYGWSYGSANLSINTLKKYIVKGLQYVYSDSQELNSNPDFLNLMSPKYKTFGSIKVFQVLPNQGK